MTPHFFCFTGSYDQAGKVLTMSGEGPSPHDGSPARFRTTDERLGQDQRRFEMFLALPGGKEQRMFSYLYSRAK